MRRIDLRRKQSFSMTAKQAISSLKAVLIDRINHDQIDLLSLFKPIK